MKKGRTLARLGDDSRAALHVRLQIEMRRNSMIRRPEPW
jgi:hypothetical protein